MDEILLLNECFQLNLLHTHRDDWRKYLRALLCPKKYLKEIVRYNGDYIKNVIKVHTAPKYLCTRLWTIIMTTNIALLPQKLKLDQLQKSFNEKSKNKSKKKKSTILIHWNRKELDSQLKMLSFRNTWNCIKCPREHG